MTQPNTLQASRTAAQMATALASVDVVRIGDLMEARHRDTGHILGTAIRSGLGWVVRVRPNCEEILISPAVAELVLRYLAARRLDDVR